MMNQRHLRRARPILACAAVALLLPAAVQARGGGHGLDRIDANRDGAISAAEFTAAGAVRFVRLDANGDGVISREEYLAPRHREVEGGEARKIPEGIRKKIEARRAERFAGLDTDGNGTVSRQEYSAGEKALFARLDANRDGKVTGEELARARQDRMFSYLDTNGDGTVSAAEFTAAGGHIFARLDTNSDGTISREEYLAPRHREGEGSEARKIPEGIRKKIEARRAARFARLDTDGDGSISRKEFDAGGERFFARIDADGDGKITKQEMTVLRHRDHCRNAPGRG